MRALLALLLVATVLAGCSDDDGKPSTPSTSSTTSAPLVGVDVRPGGDGHPSTGEGATTYGFDLANQTYADQLVRHTLTLTSNATVSATFAIRMGTYANRDDCAASSFQAFAPAGNATGFGASAVLWAWQNHIAVRVAAAGVDQTIDPSLEDGTGGAPQVVGGTFRRSLPAGTVLVIEQGGHSELFANGHFQDPQSSQSVPNEHVLTVVVNGTATLAREDARTVRCGEGPAQATGHTVYTQPWIGQTSVGGTVQLDGANAGTAIIATTTASTAEVTAAFGDETFGNEDVRRTSGEPTTMGLAFGAWSSPSPSYYWFLADTYWPALHPA